MNCKSPCSPTPTARQSPRREILSTRRRSTSARCASVITEFSGFRTKARPQCLQRWFCFPVWICPFLLYHVDPYCGHASLLIMVLPLASPLSVFVLVKNSTDLMRALLE